MFVFQESPLPEILVSSNHVAEAQACCVYGGTPWESQAAALEVEIGIRYGRISPVVIIKIHGFNGFNPVLKYFEITYSIH